ncbi:MAG: lysophospholipid acyltransferase family protein [Thermoplasmatota archaeon]
MPKEDAAGTALAPADTQDNVDVGFLEKIAPTLRRLRNYSRLKVDGLDNVPETGPALLACNHTGWLGLDYAFTALSVYEALDRVPRGMAHAAWFGNPATKEFASKAGLFKVSKGAMEEQLAKGNLVLIFPEGEKGAFSPGKDYTLEEFARGFVRVAMKTNVPVIPVAILGGEEANPVGTRIESYEELIKMKGGLPIPKNLIPKPVKWRIRFLPAIDFSMYTAADADDHDLVHSLSEHVRARVQRELRKMKVERGNPYL